MADLAPTLPFKRASISIIPDFQDTVILTEYNLTDYIDKLNEMGWVDLRIENDLLQFSQLNSYGWMGNVEVGALPASLATTQPADYTATIKGALGLLNIEQALSAAISTMGYQLRSGFYISDGMVTWNTIKHPENCGTWMFNGHEGVPYLVRDDGQIYLPQPFMEQVYDLIVDKVQEDGDSSISITNVQITSWADLLEKLQQVILKFPSSNTSIREGWNASHAMLQTAIETRIGDTVDFTTDSFFINVHTWLGQIDYEFSWFKNALVDSTLAYWADSDEGHEASANYLRLLNRIPYVPDDLPNYTEAGWTLTKETESAYHSATLYYDTNGWHWALESSGNKTTEIIRPRLNYAYRVGEVWNCVLTATGVPNGFVNARGTVPDGTSFTQQYTDLISAAVFTTELEGFSQLNWIPTEMFSENPTVDGTINPTGNPDDHIDDLVDAAEEEYPHTDDPESTDPDEFTDDQDDAGPMIGLYNPTVSQLNSFKAWLWTDQTFLDAIKKLFVSPIEAIISLYKIYAAPQVLGTGTITCGYIQSTVTGVNLVGQHTYVDCGSVTVPRYFYNILDWNPHTKVQIFLPFVGFQDLDTDDVIGSTIAVKYGIDVLTGDCLATVRVSRDGITPILYEFSGNCGVQIPVTSGERGRYIFNAITSVAPAVAGAVLAPGVGSIGALAMSSASAIAGSKIPMRRSGSVTGNSGVFGPRQPFLIISRPVPGEAAMYNHYYGMTANRTVRLGDCSGFTRVRELHLDSVIATDEELNEINDLLREGVII